MANLSLWPTKEFFVNYNTSNNAYRAWDPSRHTVYNVAVRAFDETAQPGWWRVSPKPKAIEAAEMEVIFPDLLLDLDRAPEVFDAASTIEQTVAVEEEVHMEIVDPTFQPQPEPQPQPRP